MELGLRGKNALVTGGSHGIGRAIALGLAAEGVNVAICSRTKERVQGVLKEIEALGVQALGVEADVLNPEDIKKVTAEVEKKFKAIHILINNVGGGGSWGDENVEKTSDEVWVQVYEKNALAAVRFSVWALPFMRKQKWGRVITITSKYGREGGGRPWFTMAKSAEMALMKTLALDPKLARNGITFNSVAPGNIMIPETGWATMKKERPEEFAAIMESSPQGRLGTPEEVAPLVVFLASDQAAHVTGTSIPVDGAESRSF
jgi:3-oxoacyl-[acyl-carrier protein] reductase